MRYIGSTGSTENCNVLQCCASLSDIHLFASWHFSRSTRRQNGDRRRCLTTTFSTLLLKCTRETPAQGSNIKKENCTVVDLKRPHTPALDYVLSLFLLTAFSASFSSSSSGSPLLGGSSSGRQISDLLIWALRKIFPSKRFVIKLAKWWKCAKCEILTPQICASVPLMCRLWSVGLLGFQFF